MKQTHLGERVALIKPRWLPNFLVKFYDKNIGNSGVIIHTDIGEYSGCEVCFVAFDKVGDEDNAVGVYLYDQLEPSC